MAYTFGGATSDDVTMTPAFGSSTNGSMTFTCGWWYPTTLTATRYYVSGGNLYGMEVDSTTANFRFRTDNTTDGQWTAPGAVTVDKWWFIAFVSSTSNTGPTGNFRCWVGDAETPPAEITVTNAVAPVGNFTGGTAFTVGNRGTGTLAFQGDVGWVSRITTAGAGNMLGIAAGGTITDDEAFFIRYSWVLPLWQGRPKFARTPAGTTANYSIAHIPLNAEGASYELCTNENQPSATSLTINGATLSQRAPPSTPPANWPLMAYKVRRAA